MTSEPMMPRGRSRLGFLVSSAAVATMSKPMNAKKTIAAPAKMPPTPKVVGVKPAMSWISGAVSRAAARRARLGGRDERACSSPP